MPTLRVLSADQTLEVALERSILDAVMDAAIPISTSCGGVAACGLCRVTVRAGMEHLRPANERELHHLGSATIAAGTRLACQARFVADGVVEVEIPQVSTVDHRQEKYTRMMRARRAEATARGRARAPTRGQTRGPTRPPAASAPASEKSNAPPRALEEGAPRPSRRRRRRRKR